jgi:hypothetical protein
LGGAVMQMIVMNAAPTDAGVDGALWHCEAPPLKRTR